MLLDNRPMVSKGIFAVVQFVFMGLLLTSYPTCTVRGLIAEANYRHFSFQGRETLVFDEVLFFFFLAFSAFLDCRPSGSIA